jgi:hypothetical protein
LTQNDSLTEPPKTDDENDGEDSQDDGGELPDNDYESNDSSSDES